MIIMVAIEIINNELQNNGGNANLRRYSAPNAKNKQIHC